MGACGLSASATEPDVSVSSSWLPPARPANGRQRARAGANAYCMPTAAPNVQMRTSVAFGPSALPMNGHIACARTATRALTGMNQMNAR